MPLTRAYKFQQVTLTSDKDTTPKVDVRGAAFITVQIVDASVTALTFFGSLEEDADDAVVGPIMTDADPTVQVAISAAFNAGDIVRVPAECLGVSKLCVVSTPTGKSVKIGTKG